MVDAVMGKGQRRLPNSEQRPLRVAHVTATFPPYRGGTGNVAYHNARELAEHGHDVHVFTSATSSPDQEDLAGITVHRLPTRFRVGNAPLLPQLGQSLSSFDIVHLHYPFYFGGEQVWWSCTQQKTKYVVTYHQDVHLSWPLSVGVKLHHKLFGLRVLRNASVVAATTMDYARTSRLSMLPPRQIVELPNGVDTERFRPGLDTRTLRSRYKLENTREIILFVGALDKAHYFKGIPTLLDALALLPNATLIIVGDGDQRENYEKMAVQAGLGARVCFAGRVKDEDLPLYFSMSNVAVLPSTTGGEAFGMVLIEAMATATPVVASHLPGVRVVVDDDVNGFLAAPGNAHNLAAKIRTLLDNPELQRSMGVAGRRKVEQKYDWRKIGDRLERIYFEVLEPRRKAWTKAEFIDNHGIDNRNIGFENPAPIEEHQVFDASKVQISETAA